MGEKLSILVVEDNELNQKVITFSLRKLDCEVKVANNGLEGYELFKKHKFDVVLMDIMMPVMDGFESTKNIRKYEKEQGVNSPANIIAVTANTLDNDRDKCIAGGMNDFMAKPFNLERLKEILSTLGRDV